MSSASCPAAKVGVVISKNVHGSAEMRDQRLWRPARCFILARGLAPDADGLVVVHEALGQFAQGLRYGGMEKDQARDFFALADKLLRGAVSEDAACRPAAKMVGTDDLAPADLVDVAFDELVEVAGHFLRDACVRAVQADDRQIWAYIWDFGVGRCRAGAVREEEECWNANSGAALEQYRRSWSDFLGHLFGSNGGFFVSEFGGGFQRWGWLALTLLPWLLGSGWLSTRWGLCG